MTLLKTALDTRSDEFRRNADAMRSTVADLRARVAEIKRGGDEAARAFDRDLDDAASSHSVQEAVSQDAVHADFPGQVPGGRAAPLEEGEVERRLLLR